MSTPLSARGQVRLPKPYLFTYVNLLTGLVQYIFPAETGSPDIDIEAGCQKENDDSVGRWRYWIVG